MIYICGDSFAVSDPQYGPCWVDILSQQFPVCNLAQVGATNLLIARQVDIALDQGAAFIILLCTAVTRSEKRWGDRYVSFSYHTAGPDTTPFDKNQLRILKEYYTEFFDLDLAIYQNSITIEHTLRKITDHGVPFRFDQGGFENIEFANAKTNYFTTFEHCRASINLWNCVTQRLYRPYYHIIDPAVHQQVADYYTKEIQSVI